MAAAEPPPEQPPAEAAPESEAAPAAEPSGGNDSSLPAWARSNSSSSSSEPAPPSEPAEEPASVSSPAPAPAEKEKPEAPSNRTLGPVNDFLATVGGTIHYRSGLKPKHEAKFFPGIRLDGQVFLGSLFDTVFIRDIGFGGMYDMSLALQYGYASAAGSAWSAEQQQYRTEILYRLQFDSGMAPTFLLRLGIGKTACIINSSSTDQALSASYTAPHIGLDFHIKLGESTRLWLSGGGIFMVKAAEKVRGTGIGFNLQAGVDFDFFSFLHLGLGYDLTQYMMKDSTQGGMGEYSDTFQAGYIRIGLNYQ